MYKMGDLVVFTGVRDYPHYSLNSTDKRFTILIGKILKIGKVEVYSGWEYKLIRPDGGVLMVNSDQIVPARIAKTEIYKALTEET